MEREKINVSLTSEALEIVNANATERKRGEWLSTAIVAYAQFIEQSAQFAELGVLERFEAKMDRILAVVSAIQTKQK